MIVCWQRIELYEVSMKAIKGFCHNRRNRIPLQRYGLKHKEIFEVRVRLKFAASWSGHMAAWLKASVGVPARGLAIETSSIYWNKCQAGKCFLFWPEA